MSAPVVNDSGFDWEAFKAAVAAWWQAHEPAAQHLFGSAVLALLVAAIVWRYLGTEEKKGKKNG